MGQTIASKFDLNKGVLAHVCEILDCFSKERSELGVRELARLTGFSSSTAGRLLVEMKERGILRQNPDTKTYSLGIRLLTWTGVYLAGLDIRAIAMPVMSELQRLTLETISLYILDGTDRVCVERLESPQNVRIVARLGLRLPLYAGSAGKVILAFLPEDQQEKILTSVSLEPFTRYTITDQHILRDEIIKVRKNGFAYSHGEWIKDASGVAAPIFGPDQVVIGAITISGPTQRFTREVIEKYGREAVSAALEISEQAGFSSHSKSKDYRIRP